MISSPQRRRRLLASLGLWGVLLTQACHHAPPLYDPPPVTAPWEPWGQAPATVEPTARAPEAETPGSTGEWLVSLYQKHLRRPKGVQRCPFQPSCSRYTRTAIARHGFLAGVLLGFDRLLIRENFDAGRRYLLHFHDGQLYFHDPVP